MSLVFNYRNMFLLTINKILIYYVLFYENKDLSKKDAGASPWCMSTWGQFNAKTKHANNATKVSVLFY